MLTLMTCALTLVTSPLSLNDKKYQWFTESDVVQIRDKFAASFGCSKAKRLSALTP